MQEMGLIPGSGRFLREGNGCPLRVFLSGECPGTEKPGGLQPMGSQSVKHNWVFTHTRIQCCLEQIFKNNFYFIFLHWNTVSLLYIKYSCEFWSAVLQFGKKAKCSFLEENMFWITLAEKEASVLPGWVAQPAAAEEATIFLSYYSKK